MLIECAWCGRDMGEKEPLDIKDTTHGICEECLEKFIRIDKDELLKQKAIIY